MTSIDDLLNIESDDITDIKSWINGVISSETSDKELKDLIMKLQFVSQDIDKSLDRLQDQLSQSIPSLKQILNDISSESISLKQDFIGINRDVNTINQRNKSVIGNLSEIYSIENKMNLCIDSLSEIYQWETRIKKVNKLFEKREFELISKELNLMRSRVEMLKNNMPQLYEKRNVMVQEFIDKLENMIIPFLNETFEKHDYRSFRYYSQILLTINPLNFNDEINKQYIINRLDTMKQLLQHFSHKNKRLNNLDIWFNEFLLNLLQFFQNEWDWSLQIFNNRDESIKIIKKLIISICDEINIELREWISIFIKFKNNDCNEKCITMNKLLSLFQIFNNFFISVYNSRLLTNDHQIQSIAGITKTFQKKKDILQLLPNINKLISNLLNSYYKKTYYNLEKYILFSIFDTSIISMSNNNENDIKMPTPIRWIQESQLNELSFIDINERIEDSVISFVETIQNSHKRCILISHGALIKDIISLYDSFIIQYIDNLDKLLQRCPYDPSKMISPLQSDDASNNNNNHDDVINLYSSPKSAEFNWIIDLKQAFILKKKINSVAERITDCIDKILTHFNKSINALCNIDNTDNNGSILFYRIFLSNSELQLLSKYKNIGECKKLFIKSLNQSLSNDNLTNIITQKIDNRIENILLNIMMQEIKICINNIHSLSIWTEKPKKSHKILNLPQFNPQPNEYIKKIGTHLLALVQQLESHTNDNEQNNNKDSMNMMNMMINNDDDEENEEIIDIEQEERKESHTTTATTEESIDSEKWLNLVLNESVQTLFMELYKLNGLSLKGTKQLITDLDYLCNVANAIYLDEPEFIYSILTVLQCKLGNSNTLKQRLISNNEDHENNKKTQPKLRTSFQRKIATKFAVLRGLNVRFV